MKRYVSIHKHTTVAALAAGEQVCRDVHLAAEAAVLGRVVAGPALCYGNATGKAVLWCVCACVCVCVCVCVYV